MLKPIHKKRFEKDVKQAKKQGRDLSKLKLVLTLLTLQEKLPTKYRDRKLIGNFKDRRSCHIEPDWVLIYKLEGDQIIFERTGSHSDLYR